jgi:N-acetylglutamate synthase-like GNAT family acetyltransferase
LNSRPSINLRFAKPDDAPAIALLLSESFAEYQLLYTPEGFAATAIPAAGICNRIDEGPVWVAMQDGRMVGTAAVVARAESLYIRGMAVHPTARGRQIGNMLLAEIEKFATSAGFTRLYLSTTPWLDHAIRLYERFGFQRTDEGPGDLFGTPLFTMEKVLPETSLADRA